MHIKNSLGIRPLQKDQHFWVTCSCAKWGWTWSLFSIVHNLPRLYFLSEEDSKLSLKSLSWDENLWKKLKEIIAKCQGALIHQIKKKFWFQLHEGQKYKCPEHKSPMLYKKVYNQLCEPASSKVGSCYHAYAPNNTYSISFHAELPLSFGPANWQCCITTLTVVVYRETVSRDWSIFSIR